MNILKDIGEMEGKTIKKVHLLMDNGIGFLFDDLTSIFITEKPLWEGETYIDVITDPEPYDIKELYNMDELEFEWLCLESSLKFNRDVRRRELAQLERLESKYRG